MSTSNTQYSEAISIIVLVSHSFNLFNSLLRYCSIVSKSSDSSTIFWNVDKVSSWSTSSFFSALRLLISSWSGLSSFSKSSISFSISSILSLISSSFKDILIILFIRSSTEDFTESNDGHQNKDSWVHHALNDSVFFKIVSSTDSVGSVTVFSACSTTISTLSFWVFTISLNTFLISLIFFLSGDISVVVQSAFIVCHLSQSILNQSCNVCSSSHLVFHLSSISLL